MRVDLLRRFHVGLPFAVVLLLAGCESDSTIDSVMNSSSDQTGAKSDSQWQSSDAKTEAGITGSPAVGVSGATAGGAGMQSMAGIQSVTGNQSDMAIRVDQPRVTRDNFSVRVSIAARERLLEQTDRLEKSFVLVGRVTPTVDDWQHIEFVDFYDQDRQFQFRTNGIKILVPRELVNRLHNATIDWDASSKNFFVKLAN
ncbi:hypothetical protein SH449x_003381 [Pirellulaceae bacterium SH449]